MKHLMTGVGKATAFAVSLSLVGALASNPTSAATVKAGSKCSASQVGKTQKNAGGQLRCRKVGSATRWVQESASASTTAPPATTAAPTSAAPTTTAATPTTAAPAAGADGQGVTPAAIKIGVVEVVIKGPTGFIPSATGSFDDQIAAITANVNARGGIGGRKIQIVSRKMDLAGNNAQQGEAICSAFGDDEKVFAVIPQAMPSEFQRECFAKKKILILDSATFPFDGQLFDKLKPYFFQVTFPSVGRIVAPYAKTLSEEGWLTKDAKVGILSLDTESWRRSVDSMKTELKKYGTDVVDTVYANPTSQADITRDMAAAAPRFAAKGITHVIALESGANNVSFMFAAEDNQYYPKYSLTSFDSPRLTANAAPLFRRAVQQKTLTGAVGIGFYPQSDVEDVQFPFPGPTAEKNCISVYRAKTIITGFDTRNNSRYAQTYCDSLLFLKTVADSMKGPLNADTFAAAAQTLGSTGFDSSQAFLTKFTPGRFDGGDGYRVLKYDPTCTRPINGCFNYTSPVKPLS